MTGALLSDVRFALLIALLVTCRWASAAAVPRNDRQSWPTLHGDLQRSGFYPEFPEKKLKVAWRRELWRELTGPRAEVIVGGGLAFMGTYAGNMYAWDAATGKEHWVFKTDGPIGHSPAFENETLYFGSMDHQLYAVDVRSGKSKWHFEAGEGFWTSPAVDRGLVLCGARDGVFYALHENSGDLAWKVQTGDRILSSASISEDGTRAIFASEDMRVYCLNVSDGNLIWKSRKLQGLTVRDYFPVIYHDLAFITTSPVKDFHTVLGQHQEMLVKRTGFTGKDPRYIPGDASRVREEQDFVVDYLKKNPAEQTFYAFRISDGSEPWIAPILYTGGLHNPLTPPCYDPISREIFTQVRSAYGVWDGGGEVRPFTGFGRLDPETGRVALLEHSYKPKEPDRPAGAKDTPWGAFAYIGDETQTLSCSPNFLFSNHQGNMGALDLKTGRLSNKYGRRDTYGGFYGPGNFGWEKSGGPERAQAAGQPFGLVNEWHGPARAIVSVARGRVYFGVGSQVICLEGEQ